MYGSLNFAGATFKEADSRSQEHIENLHNFIVYYSNRIRISVSLEFLRCFFFIICTIKHSFNCIYVLLHYQIDRVSDTQVLYARRDAARILWQLEIGGGYRLCNSREVFSCCPLVVISGGPDLTTVRDCKRRKISADLFLEFTTFLFFRPPIATFADPLVRANRFNVIWLLSQET